ncbi:hypothetical protein IDAT_10085 [Pseudidiomarina atlantica]|uniref:Lipoprotein n=1 Tax=Pseudidiomarina atlantica TaxID=1517416 RepID=A0A094IL04_9GAMM|nr:hypothetical protein [Pseudidiomarina atlantica]KFZ28340.1 hypothetical protein IDAT_10085 [Pseudidiomarina atlantica]
MKYALLAFGLTLLTGCGGSIEEPSQSVSAELSTEQPEMEPARDSQAEFAELDQQIRSMIGMAYADNLEQCKLAAIGHRPCGGPEYYMAYSTAALDEQVLLKLIDEHRELQTAFQQDNDIVGTCEMISKPLVVLNGGRCLAQPTAER